MILHVRKVEGCVLQAPPEVEHLVVLLGIQLGGDLAQLLQRLVGGRRPWS